MMQTRSSQEPVIIAGAGPCGLFTAITLKREGVPFVILERARAESLMSNVGAGFDITATTVRLFERLGLAYENRICWKYQAAHVEDMHGSVIREFPMNKLGKKGSEQWSAQRSTMMQAFMEALGSDIDLRCGVAIESFEETEDNVIVSLSDGSTVSGCALLACDGVKSAVRRQMYTEAEDPMHYAGVVAWWGISIWEKGDDVFEEMVRNVQDRTFFQCLGDARSPGSFFADKALDSDNKILWCFFGPSKQEPGQSDDLRRRGGVTGEGAKAEISQRFQGRSETLRRLVENTPAKGITMVGLYDRKNLDLPYLSRGGRAVLLGDAAHPQTPFLGMGVNMALTDGFVIASRLAKQDPKAALASFDTEARKTFNTKTINDARWWANLGTTTSCVKNTVMRNMIKYLPPAMVVNDIVTVDNGNRDFVDATLKDLGMDL